MKIYIISGFLGSGKTTLLLSLARFFSDNDYRTAIIENEIGNVPVDSVLLKSQGFSVKELFAGCICCSIRQDLAIAVKDIKQSVDTDILLIEPTGVAAPDIVTDIIREALDDEDSLETLLVVDYKRVGTEVDPKKYLMKLPFLTRSLQVCDYLLLNIPENVDTNVLKSVTEVLSRVAGGKQLYVLDARNQQKVNKFITEIGAGSGFNCLASSVPGPNRSGLVLAVASTTASPDRNGPFLDHVHYENTAVVTFSKVFSPAVNSEMGIPRDIASKAKEMMMHISNDVQKTAFDAEGHSNVEGHIKAYVSTSIEGEVQDGLFLNATQFGSKISMQGKILTGNKQLSLVINAIVYGMSQDDLEQIIHKHVDQFYQH